MRSPAIIIALLVVGGSVAFFIHLSSGKRQTQAAAGAEDLPPPPVGSQPLTLRDSASCKPCHPEVYAEWEASHHRMAYTNPEVQRLSREFQDRDCLPCHLPRPVFETGLGVRVLERATRKAEGVDCFTCHRSGNACLGTGQPGAVGRDAPCNPAHYAPMASMLLCAPCHDQHKVHQDWRQSRFAVKGDEFRDCNACHMPAVERKGSTRGQRPGRSHLFPAAHDPEMIRSAATLKVVPAGANTVRITVENTGAGHNFPADERHRAADLEITVLSGGRDRLAFRVDRFRNPYREEFGIKNPLRAPGATASWDVQISGIGKAVVQALRRPAPFNPERKVYYPESTQIPAGEARVYTVRLPDVVTEVMIRLWYRTNPYQENVDSVLVAEQRVSLQ